MLECKKPWKQVPGIGPDTRRHFHNVVRFDVGRLRKRNAWLIHALSRLARVQRNEDVLRLEQMPHLRSPVSDSGQA